MLSVGLGLVAGTSPAAAAAATPSIVGWAGGASSITSELDNVLQVSAPGTGRRVVELDAERSPAGAGNWSDPANEFPYYQQVATTDQTNLPFSVPKTSFQGRYDYRIHARQWEEGDGAHPSAFSAWLYFSATSATTKPVSPYPMLPKGETAPKGVILRADASALPITGQPIDQYEFEIKSAHAVYDANVDSLSLWTKSVAAPAPGTTAKAPVDSCQSLSSYGLCSGAGNLVNSTDGRVDLRWRVRAKSTGRASSDWSRWRYFDTNWSQSNFWYVPNRAGSYLAGPQSGDEASALVASKQYPGVYWFIRDAGKPENRNKLYAIRIDPETGRLGNIDGYTTKEFPVSGVDDVDWESLSIDDSGNIWIGDVGNFYRKDDPGLPASEAAGQDRFRNSTAEPDLRLFQVPEPNPETQTTAAATKTAPFKYPDNGDYNSEATFWLGGSMFLVTKAATGPQKIFRFPPYISSTQADNVLSYVGNLGVNVPPITDASVSTGNARIALTTEGSRAIIYEGPQRTVADSAQAEALVKDFLVNGEPQYHYYYRSAAALQADGKLPTYRPQAGPDGQFSQTTMAIEGVAWQPNGDRLNMISEYGNHVLSVPRQPTHAFRVETSKDDYNYWGWGVRRGSGSGLPTAADNGAVTSPAGDPIPSPAVPLPAGSTWNYRDDGIVPNGFEQPYYYGAGWKVGRGELGVGDGDEVTLINRSAPSHTTDYFRRSFNITNASEYSAIDLRMVVDDGAVVYINGVPVTYYNMGTSPRPKSTAFSLAGVDGAQETAIVSRKISHPPLHDGVNWIAVEVHQADLTSSDTSFDLELRKHTNLPPESFSVTGSANADGVTIEAIWSQVPNASEYRLYRRDLRSASLAWTLVGTYTGASGTYTPPDRKTELADYKLTAVANGVESVATFGQRILFTQDPNFNVSHEGYVWAHGGIDVTTAPIPTASSSVALPVTLTAAAAADPIPGDEIAVAVIGLLAVGTDLVLLYTDANYVTTEGTALFRDNFDADGERVKRATERAKSAITNYLLAQTALSAVQATAVAVDCIDDVAKAKTAGRNIPGADALGLINGEHPCASMPIFLPGPRASGGAYQPQTFGHVKSALEAARYWHILTRADKPATIASTSSSDRYWYTTTHDPRCDPKPSGSSCDEFPFFKTSEGGPAGAFPNTGASLQLVPSAENSSQGGDISGFYSSCALSQGEQFIIVPLPSVLIDAGDATSKRVCRVNP